MPDVLLDPPVVCCEKTCTSQRALDAHRRSHKRCPSCGCEGSKWVLSRHVCGAAEDPAAASERTRSALPEETTDEFRRKDGSLFTVVDEAPTEQLPLEQRFPGARIVHAAPPAASQVEVRHAPATPPAVAVPPPADDWRVLLVLGRTASGKSIALASLGSRLGPWTPPPGAIFGDPARAPA